MSAHIATAAEIGGSCDADEVKVLHVSGPYQGMLLVNKKNDATLSPAEGAGEIILESGAIPHILTVQFWDPNGVAVKNPPTAYPYKARLDVRPSPIPATDFTSLTVKTTLPGGAVVTGPVAFVNANGPGTDGPYQAEYDITQAGNWIFEVSGPGGYKSALTALTMQPVAVAPANP
jgi:hypothetical protein